MGRRIRAWRRMGLPKAFICIFSVTIFLEQLIIREAGCAPPDPVQCAFPNHTLCTLSSTYGTWPDRTPCNVASVLYPTTERELVAAVALGVRTNQKMKLVSKGSHSIPKLVCPGGSSGLLISTRDLSHNITINTHALTVTADSGFGLRELVDAVAAAGYALPHSPYWQGVTIGGLISTGAHGSSLFGRGSAVHEFVVGIRLVVPATDQEGYAKIIELNEHDEDLNAAKVSLGVLGAISQVTLALQPLFKRSLTNLMKDDTAFENEILPFAHSHEFADFTWYPSQHKVVYRMDDRLSANASGNGINDYIGFQPTASLTLISVRSLEDTAELTRNGEGKCLQGRTQTSTILSVGAGFKNNKVLFTGYPIVGFQHQMQTSGRCLYADSGLLDVCGWDPRIKGLFFHQTTVSIPISNISSFILDIKKLRDMSPTSLCGVDLYDGFLMRTVKSSTAYLGEPEDAIDIDITYYRSHDAKTPRLFEDVLEEIEQMALLKYKGRPHWGKNRNLAFRRVIDKYPNVSKFLQVREKLDPQGFFSSEWSDSVLGIGGGSVTSDADYCALEGLCICSEDRHCAPDKGYLCSSGMVYPEARVCRYMR